MGTEHYTEADIKQLLDALTVLSPRQQKLVRALIARALEALQQDDDEGIQIQVVEPDGDDTAAVSLAQLIDIYFAPGPIPDDQRVRAAKIGSGFSITLPRDNG